MKIYCLVFCFALSLGHAFCQSKEKVDKIRGFDQFIFGSIPEKYKGTIELDLTISYGVKYYKYRGRQPDEIFGYKIKDANLGFRDDKLEYIDFYMNKLSEEDFNLLASKLSVEFGDFRLLENVDEKGVLNAVEWKGGNTLIQLYRYNNEAIDDQDRRKTVLMITDISR